VGQLSGFLEDFKVFVVGEDLNIVRGTFKIMTPFFQGLDNG